MSRCVGTVVALAALASALLSVVVPAAAQQPAPGAGRPKAKTADPAPAPAAEQVAWAWRCTNQTQNKAGCEMSQTIVDRNGRVQALITVSKASDGATSVMVFRIPHGAYLPSGLSVVIDDAPPLALPFQKSDPQGVYAALPMSDKVLSDLRKARQFKLVVQINKGEDLPIAGSLAGFGAVYDRIQAMR